LPFWVYILQSESFGRYYCGQTNSLDLRIDEHNEPNYIGTKTTKRFKGPWRLVWNKDCLTRSRAMKLERIIKKRGIKRYLIENEGLDDYVTGC